MQASNFLIETFPPLLYGVLTVSVCWVVCKILWGAMLVLSWDINGIWCRIESEIGLVFKYLKNQTPFKGENVICQANIYSQQIVGSLKSMDYKKTGFDGICANATKNDSRLCDLVSPTVLDRPCITLSSSSWGVGYARQTVQQKNKWLVLNAY